MKIPGAHSCQAPGRAVSEGVRTSVGQQSLEDPLRAPCVTLRNRTGVFLLRSIRLSEGELVVDSSEDSGL